MPHLVGVVDILLLVEGVKEIAGVERRVLMAGVSTKVTVMTFFFTRLVMGFAISGSSFEQGLQK